MKSKNWRISVIQLHPDLLLLPAKKEEGGGWIPCSAQELALEITADTGYIDKDLLQNAVAGVLHYFREELKRDQVSVEEFRTALEFVLTNFGVHLQGLNPSAEPDQDMVFFCDLVKVAATIGQAGELGFYTRIAIVLREFMQRSPRMIRVTGLRDCVKHLVGARRWSRRCTETGDQIIGFLQQVFASASTGGETRCVLLIS
jgi:hypothetical protein